LHHREQLTAKVAIAVKTVMASPTGKRDQQALPPVVDGGGCEDAGGDREWDGGIVSHQSGVAQPPATFPSWVDQFEGGAM
jgi:hypothetical protein